jgi:hypothetical protein
VSGSYGGLAKSDECLYSYSATTTTTCAFATTRSPATERRALGFQLDAELQPVRREDRRRCQSPVSTTRSTGARRRHDALAAHSFACSDKKGTTPYETTARGRLGLHAADADWTVTQISDENIGLQNVIESAPDEPYLLTWDNGGTTRQVQEGKTPRALHAALRHGERRLS